MRLFPALLFSSPAFAAAHSGVATPRTGPELSDFALFVMAALGVWLVRRTMRARRRREDATRD